MTSTKSPKLLAITLLAALAVLAVPSTAPASPRQLSLIQDARELLGLSGQDPAASMAELKRLGVDVVRTNVIFHKKGIHGHRKPQPCPPGRV